MVPALVTYIIRSELDAVVVAALPSVKPMSPPPVVVEVLIQSAAV